ncbi:hypothetical protein [Vibrio ulleungensis]|uniref:Uncharacterized protein n=1 Tax=Vibrio ulleungensis TaxID=2807619 RepID=A0ABS2HG28_9VIBR|nr:hypothetical protein [Vibrio ulleungensis]MBM7035616.1 hypothetical protein [Vibrio ulleungensis]
MSEFVDKMQVATKAQSALLKAEMKRTKITAVLVVISVLCMLIALLGLNAGFYFYLMEQQPQQAAALTLAGTNFVLGVIPLIVANNLQPSDEEKLLQDIRDRAYESATGPITQLLSPTKSLDGLSPLIGLAIKTLIKK